ncbi:SRPBCC domain-containing protein [Nocardia sp. NBC_00403]|uniref:SRPBCC domain-containing protein n=1 Tax=Nocardia sp. NBC_00403 TaxID=2975990 RepID=UPI002E1A37DD
MATEKLWQALTDPAFADRYWGASFETDWRPGSEMAWKQQDWTSKDPEQVVLESDPDRKLSYTWVWRSPLISSPDGQRRSGHRLARAAVPPRPSTARCPVPGRPGNNRP